MLSKQRNRKLHKRSPEKKLEKIHNLAKSLEKNAIDKQID